LIIRENTHSTFKLPKLVTDVDYISYEVTFTPTCRYILNEKDQLDVNKLFGIGYFSNPFYKKQITIFGKKINIPFVKHLPHINSVRFGWRYCPSTDLIEILSYWYKNGVRNIGHIYYVPIGKKFKYVLEIDTYSHMLTIEDCLEEKVYSRHLIDLRGSDIGYLLRPYFGGNTKAPHDIWITMK
jgi:hypothetical protein